VENDRCFTGGDLSRVDKEIEIEIEMEMEMEMEMGRWRDSST